MGHLSLVLARWDNRARGGGSELTAAASPSPREPDCAGLMRRLAEGDPPSLDPDVLVRATSSDYFSMRDPVLETALATH